MAKKQLAKNSAGDKESVEKKTSPKSKKTTSAKKTTKRKKPPIVTPKKKYQGENLLTIYIVVKVAIYNHDIFGAYRNKDEAIEVANSLAFSEVGGHHTYDVVEIPLNALKQISYNERYGQSCEQKTVFTSTKKLATPENESMLFGWEV